MGNGYAVQPTDAWDQLRQFLQDARRRLRELEALDGSQIYNTVQDLRNLIDGLLDATEVNVTGNITSSAGNITASTGNITASTGNITASTGNITASTGFIYTPAGYGYDITYTRRAAWLGNDGRLAWASSSIEKKHLIDDVELPDPRAILEIADVYYVYRAEVDKRDNPDNPEYDPNYRVHIEYGHIAEWLHEQGLWQAVAYEDGEPVGIHDNVLAGFAIRAAKYVWSEHLALVERVEALEKR